MFFYSLNSALKLIKDCQLIVNSIILINFLQLFLMLFNKLIQELRSEFFLIKFWKLN